jgi:hydrogenase maturation protease
MSAERILIAGIGNIFQGDDAFGVEVARRLSEKPWPQEVTIRDFGIRGFDLAYALNEAWDTVILVDALSRGAEPGTVFVLETDAADWDRGIEDCGLQPHGLDPLQAIRLAKSLGSVPERILVVGCEPAELGGDEGVMGLSAKVEAAIDVAVAEIGRILKEAAPAVRSLGSAT